MVEITESIYKDRYGSGIGFSTCSECDGTGAEDEFENCHDCGGLGFDLHQTGNRCPECYWGQVISTGLDCEHCSGHGIRPLMEFRDEAHYLVEKTVIGTDRFDQEWTIPIVSGYIDFENVEF